MLRHIILLISTLCFLLGASSPAFAAGAAPSQTIEAKIALETSLEKRLLSVLTRALGTNDIIVIVRADLYTADELEDEIMPGVPVKETPATAGDRVTMTMLKRLSSVVIVHKDTNKKDLALIETTAFDILGLNKKRGDTFRIEKLDMRRIPRDADKDGKAGARSVFDKKSKFSDFLNPQTLVSLLWLAALIGVLLMMYLGFLRPLLTLGRDIVAQMAASKEEKPAAGLGPRNTPQEIPILAATHRHGSGNENGNGNGHNPLDKLPFDFIDEKNLPMLAILMRRMTPRTAAVITHYLPPRLAAQVLVGMKPDKRADVIKYMSRITQLQESEVQAIEANVRKKINYVMGGEDRLAAILEQVPSGIQKDLLKTLRERDPDLGRRLGQRIVTLDDIALLESEDLKLLSRHVQLKSIAAVLRNNEEIRSRLLPKLSEGLGQWLSQEIDLSQELPDHILQTEQRNVLTALSDLVHEGAIVLKREETGLDEPLFGEEPSEPGAAAPEPEEEGPSFEDEMKASAEAVATQVKTVPVAASPAPAPDTGAGPAKEEIERAGPDAVGTPEKPVPEIPETPAEPPAPTPSGYPEIEPPQEDLGLKPLDPGEDLLPGPGTAEGGAESERRPSKRPGRQRPKRPRRPKDDDPA